MARRSLFAQSDVALDPWEGASNTVREALDEVGEQRQQEHQQTRTRRLTFRDYLALVPEPRGPLDLDRFAFQRELYDDRSASDREQVYQKATQVGVSTQSIRWALFHADVHQRTVLYTFPTDGELNDFSRHRIRPVLRASEHLLSRMTREGVNNVGQKQIGFDGWIYFRGTNAGPVDSVPADVIVFDEYDTSDQANIEGTERRVTGPLAAGLIRRVGVPSIPGFGISALFDASDQRVWTVKCGACGEQNPMRGYDAFEANVDAEKMQLVCRASKCRRALDVRIGEWVATYPDRDVRGYHIPKLLLPGRRAISDLVANSRKTKDYQRTAFFTRDLGEPYAPAEGRLALEQVQANERHDFRPVDPWGAVPPSSALRTMGVDMASARALNVVIEESVDDETTTGRKLFIGEVEDDPARGSAFVQLCRLMDVFGVHMAGIDHGPEGRFAEAFAARYPGRVYRIGFFSPGAQQKKAPEPMVVDDAEQYVSLWRTRAYDATFERFRMQRAWIPPLDALPADYATHLGHLYRQKTEVERKGQDGRKVATGQIRVDYVKTGPEDYAQAEAYNLAAIELYWRRVGLGLVLHQDPQPLADLAGGGSVDEDDVDDESWRPMAGEPGYRSGFD